MVEFPPLQHRYAVCLPLCQNLLKREVAERYPELRFAFSRPGLVTWKGDPVQGSTFDFEPALAQRSGLSLGNFRTIGALGMRLEELGFRDLVVHGMTRPPVDGREVVPSEAWATLVAEARNQLGPRGLVRLEESPAREGDVVLDLVVPGTNQDEPFFSGLHRVSAFEAPRTGVPLTVVPPPNSPSRAFSKLEEVLFATELALRSGERALDLGAAPGGASLALLLRGLHVVAVDPAEMASELALVARQRHLEFVHVRKPAGQLQRSDLGRGSSGIDWLVSDMNLAPPVALSQIFHTWPLVKRTVRGCVLTIKMNDPLALASLPRVRERFAALVGGGVNTLHVPSHRREVALVWRKPRTS